MINDKKLNKLETKDFIPFATSKNLTRFGNKCVAIMGFGKSSTLEVDDKGEIYIEDSKEIFNFLLLRDSIIKDLAISFKVYATKKISKPIKIKAQLYKSKDERFIPISGARAISKDTYVLLGEEINFFEENLNISLEKGYKLILGITFVSEYHEYPFDIKGYVSGGLSLA